MLRATLSSCSMRSRSILSCSRRCPLSFVASVPMPHSSAILPSTMRWMIDAPVGQLPTGRRDAHKLPSIVGSATRECA